MKMGSLWGVVLLIVAALGMDAAGSPAQAAAGQTLNAVRLRDAVVCGISTGTRGFSFRNPNGGWSGLDVDFCRAVAAAVLGDADKVKFVPLTVQERFRSLALGEIDILSMSATWTHSRDTSLGISFVGVSFYDGQGFMVWKDKKIDKLEDMKGARICFVSGSTTEMNLADVFSHKGLSYKPAPFDTDELALVGFEAGRCDVLTSDQSTLVGQRLDLRRPEKAVILPLLISKEPLGPAVRRGDEQWESIVRWVLFALVDAEEMGITSDNVSQQIKSRDPAVKLLLNGTDGDFASLGLTSGWVAHIIRQTGNYGEIFERNLGVNTPLGLKRGLNALWTKGGILYAPPFR